jgi:hypothetical protein
MSTRVVHCRRDRYDVYVGRPSIYGNPYSHKENTRAQFKVATREEAIEKYETWIRGKPSLLRLVKQELRGKVLGCWCVPDPCHGHVLARIAEEP